MLDENFKTYFGKFQDMDIDSLSKKEIKDYIYQKSKEKTNIYRGVISMSEEDAVLRGYDKRAKWEELMHNKIYEIARELNIKYMNTEWIASVHYEKGHPHLHFQVWDNRQGVNSYFITKEKQNRIRNTLIKYVAQEELQGYYETRDSIKENLRDKAIMLELKAFDKRYCNKKIPYLSVDQVDKFYKDFLKIKKDVSKGNTYRYKYLSSENKIKVDELVTSMINLNYDLNAEYNQYLINSEKIGKLYGEKQTKAMKENAKDEIYNILGNQVLKAIKVMNYEKEQNRYLVRCCMNSAVGLLSIINESNDARYKLFSEYSHEMSSQAKKEFMKAKANASSIEWEE